MKVFLRSFFLASLIVLFVAFDEGGSVFITQTGFVKFTSDAPLELIEAENKQLSGVLDIEKRTLAFKVKIQGFQGFNSALQREHFNENYMESDGFPESTFSGKIIEDLDLSKPGEYNVRVKGMLLIHGIGKERIIPGKLTVKSSGIDLACNFEVPLVDHDIVIPRIVYQKIAEVIRVQVKATLTPKS